MLRYRLTLAPDDNGTILVTSPDLPIVTYGETFADAVRHARDAVTAILASMIDAREDIVVPDFDEADTPDGMPCIIPSLQVQLKVQLYLALREAGLTRADLQRHLGWKRESVDRLFRLEHRSRLDQMEAAFAALGKGLNFAVRDQAPERAAA